jgi:hypothetical protein
MRSSYRFVVGGRPADGFIAPRWTRGCEVKNLDFIPRQVRDTGSVRVIDDRSAIPEAPVVAD